MNKKVGFISIVGRPNVGKSTLLNSILNFSVSITSSKPQTTREQIKGIYNDSESQIIFIDTPGIHKPKKIFGEFLNESSFSSLKDSDLVLFLSPINEEIGTGDKMIIDKLNLNKTYSVITKIDKSNFEETKERVSLLKNIGFQTVLGFSKEMPNSTKEIISFIKENLEDGDLFYPEDELTDKPLRFMAKEIIRKSTINKVDQEIPHSIAVVIDDFIESNKDGLDKFEIHSTIFVERDSQKGIIIGKDGKMIKQIGIDARKEMESIFNNRVNIFLKVKVNKNWTKNEKMIRELGY